MERLALMITAQVSLYPVESDDADGVITQSLQSLEGAGVQWEVGPVSTEIHGTPDQVWQALRSLFDQALAQSGELAMVVTLTNARP